MEIPNLLETGYGAEKARPFLLRRDCATDRRRTCSTAAPLSVNQTAGDVASSS